MKAVIAIDSFKGCMSSDTAAHAVARGLDGVQCTVLPVSDGGEGFMEIVSGAMKATIRTVRVHDPLGRMIDARYGLKGATAIIESAAASGLNLMSEDERNPLAATTRGTGEMIADAIRSGARNIYIGLGGTGTNDGGKGMLEALEGIDLTGCTFHGLCDVSTVFCGPEGASYVFGPQKGAGKEMVEILDRRLNRIAEEYLAKSGRDVLTKKGSGAAGGLGGAIWAMLGGELLPGAEAVLDLLEFEKTLEGASVVITGEGRMDRQTLQGKLPFTVASRARKYDSRIKVMAFTGSNLLSGEDHPFDEIIQITPEGTPMELAMSEAYAVGRLSECASASLICF